MANAFESFIQLELPKRPYLPEDIQTESLLIRRGPGPRQLAGLKLEENQTVVFKDGQLTPAPYGSPEGTSTTFGLAFYQEVPASVWTIAHNHANKNVVVTLLDNDFSEILADTLSVYDNEIIINFVEPQSGYANIVFL